MPISKLKASIDVDGLTAEDLLEFLWKRSVIGCCFVGPDNRIVAVNPTMAEWLGYPPTSLEGMEWSEITKGSDIKEDLAAVKSILNGDIDSYTMEKTYHTRDGGLLPAVLHVYGIKDSNGQRIVAMFSQVERADLPDATPVDDINVAWRLLGRYKKTIMVALIILTFIGTEIRAGIANGMEWFISYLPIPQDVGTIAPRGTPQGGSADTNTD